MVILKDAITMPVIVSHTIDLQPDLPNEVMDVARKQGEDPDRVVADIQELRDMIFEKGECEPPRTDDAFLIRFLRARNFKLEYAYNLLVRYCKFREDNPQLHTDVNPKMWKKLGEDDIMTVTPYRDQFGRRMLMYKLGNWQPSKIHVDEIFKGTMILVEMGAMEPISQVMGGVIIFDLEGLSLQHVWNCSPYVVKTIISLMGTCMPIRTIAIHIVNNNWAFDMAWQVFKPFLSDRMRKLIHIHGSDFDSLHQHIDKAHLSVKYGGEVPEFPYTDWMKYLGKDEKIRDELESIGYKFDQEEYSIFM